MIVNFGKPATQRDDYPRDDRAPASLMTMRTPSVVALVPSSNHEIKLLTCLQKVKDGDAQALSDLVARLPEKASLHTSEVLTAVSEGLLRLSEDRMPQSLAIEENVREDLLAFVLAFGGHDRKVISAVQKIVEYVAKNGDSDKILERCEQELESRIAQQHLSGYGMILSLLELTPNSRAEQYLVRLQDPALHVDKTSTQKLIDPHDDPFDLRPAWRILAVSGIYAMGMVNLGVFLKGQAAYDLFILGLIGFGVGMYLGYGDLKTNVERSPTINPAPCTELRRLAAESLERRRRSVE
jgi:hypothetical protein